MRNLRLFVVCFALFTAACGSLGGEPEIVSTIPAQSLEVGHPQTPPDLANGAQIFAARCASCHGIDGGGQGELVLSGQVPQMASFLDPETARVQSPDAWYETITNGRIENLMPPWRDALSEQERWDVALYTYTMHYSRDMLDIGQAIYQECAECHGLTGAGDGPEAASVGEIVPALNDLQTMITLSDRNIYNMVFEGAADAMPAYGDTLTDEEIRAVAAYTRTLMLANADQVIAQAQMSPTAQATQAPIETTRSMTVRGVVTNGSEGGSVPEDLIVTLRAFDSVALAVLPEFDRTAPVAEDGSFIFEEVRIDADKLYLAAVTYRERNFASGFAEPDMSADVLELPIQIYELTDDPSVITVTGGVTRLRVIGDSIEFQQLMQFRNTSDRLYTSLELGTDGRYSSIELGLPPGAVILGFDDDRAYTIADDGSRVYDMRPVLPGEERISLLSYLVPYGGGALIEYPVYYNVEGEIRYLVQPDSITLTSEQSALIGADEIGGEGYQVYGGTLTLEGGSLIRFELSGEALNAATLNGPAVVTSDSLVPIALIGGAVVLGVVVIVLLLVSRKGSKQAGQNATIDRLISEIAALDAQHESGEINHDLYHARRKELKARLAALMTEQNQDSTKG